MKVVVDILLTPDDLERMAKNNFRRLLCEMIGCSEPKHKIGFERILVEPDELMKAPMPRVDLTKPLKPGFRRPVSLPVDEALDKRDDGSFAAIEVVQGDSTGAVRDTSTEKQIDFYLNGDGALGDKVLRVKADGHVGPGEAEITLEIGYTVAHPDATAFGTPIEGTDEPIPTA